MRVEDKAGQLISAGDIIIYGHLLGRCAGLQYGIVKDVYQADTTFRYGGGRTPTHHFRVRGCADKYGKGYALLEKDGTLQYTDRLLVVTQSQVPAIVDVMLCDHYREFCSKRK